MEPTFDVVHTGHLKEGVSRETVLAQFAGKFNLDREKAELMLPTGGESTLKRNTDRETAEKYRAALEGIGLVVELRPAANGRGTKTATTAVSASGASSQVTPATATGEDDALHQFNPYARATPKREPELAGSGDDVEGDVAILSQKVFEGASAVPAGNGVSWLTRAWSEHVQKNLGAWVGAVLIYFVLSIVLSMIPFIGSIALLLIGPVVLAGFMIGAKEQAEGSEFTIGHMFSAFDSPGQLMLLALFYFVAMVVVVLLTFSLLGTAMFSAMDPANEGAPDLYMLSLSVLVMLALMLPVMMAYWFAPALVALDGLSAFEAMKQSFLGCLKNVLPMLVYGVVGMVFAVVAAIPLMLGFILLMPVIVASIYVGYNDIFNSSEHTFTS